MSVAYKIKKYSPPGPVAEAFINDLSDVAIIEGPMGAGKTTACFFRLFRRAMRMPICNDGKIHYRALVLRDTYRKLEKTAMRTWLKWFKKEDGIWQGGQDRPSKHLLEFDVHRKSPDGSLKRVTVIFEIEFAAIPEHDIEDWLDGFECTDIFLNAINNLPSDVLTYAYGRTGRFPDEKDLPEGATYPNSVIGDTNPPEVESWLDTYCHNLPTLAKWFRQPGGMDKGAENIHNLKGGRKYYTNLLELNKNKPWYCQKMVHNKRGYSRKGKPVYQEFNDSLHVAPQSLEIAPNLPLYIGVDGGLHPAAIAAQLLPTGQRRILRELVPGRVGANEFGRLMDVWFEQITPPAGIKSMFCDPANFYGGGNDEDDKYWVEIVEGYIDILMTEADTNALSVRLDAVRMPLKYMIDDQYPELYISPDCKILRQGFNSGYRYAKKKKSGADDDTQDFGLEPLKNDFSHPHDACQYLNLGMGGLRSLTSGKSRHTSGHGMAAGGHAKNGIIKNTTNLFG